jgi:hypothetical protein
MGGNKQMQVLAYLNRARIDPTSYTTSIYHGYYHMRIWIWLVSFQYASRCDP